MKHTEPSSNASAGNYTDVDKKVGILTFIYRCIFCVCMYSVLNNQTRIRSAILQQLKDLKSLKDDGVLDENEFSSQKDKLLAELTTL